jgi:tellurite resistance protein
VKRDDLRAQGDRDLFDRLLVDRDVARAIERIDRDAGEIGARRQLLGTALRLSPEMAPDVHALLDGCRAALGIEAPLETYVIPSPVFNAAAVRPERGLLFVLLSSGLLEAFEPDELRFVIGHELGHHLFEHHRLPVAALLGGKAPPGAGLALRLFAWQRYAEISCDRAGLVCAGSLEAAARGLFKLASGLRGGRVRIVIDQFLAQAGDLRDEVGRMARADEPARSDWFATHPFSPLRLRAAELCARSEILAPGGLPRADLEAQVQELMVLMEPSYLQEKSDVAETMRRLLLAGAVLIASASGRIDPAAIAALEGLLGPGSVPPDLKPEVLRADLPDRIAAMNRVVPALRRGQVIRDLCVIARADGRVDEKEMALLYEIAAAVGVDRDLVSCTAKTGAGH